MTEIEALKLAALTAGLKLVEPHHTAAAVQIQLNKEMK